jgi:exopolyphosphatase/guanosine-5'-triphosphate,3'-diphosphate pyrophosphatase
MDGMRVAVMDIGSNTARLLVAEQRPRSVERIGEAKAYLRLGAEILEHGAVRGAKLDETAREARRFAAVARELGAAAIDVFVTAPGRQAENPDELVATIARATGRTVRVLSAEEEGRLGFEGALATTAVGDGAVAVCDAGGGSTEITVGDRRRGPVWSRSADIGSLRLTAATLQDDPPTRAQVAAARRLAGEAFDPIRPPKVKTALVVGGSARAVARLAGRTLDENVLERALETIVSRPTDELAASTTIDLSRATTLAGGTVILLDVARLLRRPLLLANGGLREGAAARLLAQARAA